MAKFLVEGRDAGRLLDQLSANHVDGDAGLITYTQWLNEGGTLEADLTVTKLDDERFWVVASDTAHRHVADVDAAARHRRRARASSPTCTSGLRAAQRAGTALARAAAVGHRRRPVRTRRSRSATAREIDIGFARVLCVRITYLGELGYELYVPTEQAMHVYDRLVAAGERARPAARGAARRWRACAWRRGTATTATTSTTPTRCSRPGSASRSTWTSRAASSGGTRCVAQKAAGPLTPAARAGAAAATPSR